MRQRTDLPPIVEEAAAIVPDMPAHGEPFTEFDATTTEIWRPVSVDLETPDGMTRAIDDPSLLEVLTATDRELEKVAKLCGALVVNHTWAMSCVSKSEEAEEASHRKLYQDTYERLRIPLDYMLLANVTLLHDVQRVPRGLNDQLLEVISGKYYAELDAVYDDNDVDCNDYRGVVLSNMGPEQFILARQGTDRLALWLVDIEPRLIWAP